MQNQNQYCIIFGASRGIGKSIAINLAKQGFDICISSRTLNLQSQNIPDILKQQGTLKDVEDEITKISPNVLSVKCDVQNEKEIINVFNQAQSKFFNKVLTLVIYNSGAIYYGRVENTSLKKFDLLHSINVRGCFIAVQQSIQRVSKQHSAKIIVVSPPIYNRFFKGKTPYAMGKVGMSVLVQGLANELPNHISIVSLWPSTGIQSAATQRFQQNQTDYDKYLRKPDIFADAVIHIAKDNNRQINGKQMIDEDYLRTQGITNFDKYRLNKNHEPPRMMPKVFPALEVEEQNQEVFKINAKL